MDSKNKLSLFEVTFRIIRHDSPPRALSRDVVICKLENPTNLLTPASIKWISLLDFHPSAGSLITLEVE